MEEVKKQILTQILTPEAKQRCIHELIASVQYQIS